MAFAICGTCDRPAPQTRDLPRLWDDLAGDDGPAAFQAMSAMSEFPDRTVALVREKLRPVKKVIDLDHIDRGKTSEESQRLRRMKKLLVSKEPKIESAIASGEQLPFWPSLALPTRSGYSRLWRNKTPKRCRANCGRRARPADESREAMNEEL